MTKRITLTALPDIPLVEPGADLAGLIAASIRRAEIEVATGDIFVVAQKLVSKAENRYIDDSARCTNDAVRAGLREVALQGGRLVVVISSDVPGVVSSDLAGMGRGAEESQVSIAPALADGGTNALGCDLSGEIVPCFGPDSFNRHIQEARQRGIRPRVVVNRRLGLDLDEPMDVLEFLERETLTRTDSYLRSINVNGRLRELVDTVGSKIRSISIKRSFRKSLEQSCCVDRIETKHRHDARCMANE